MLDGKDGSDVCIYFDGVDEGRPQEGKKPIIGDVDMVKG